MEGATRVRVSSLRSCHVLKLPAPQHSMPRAPRSPLPPELEERLPRDIRASSHVHRNIGHPIGTFLYTVSTMHCMTVLLAQGGEGLGVM